MAAFRYQKQTEELIELLAEDQAAVKQYSRLVASKTGHSTASLRLVQQKLRKATAKRAQRAIRILREIDHEPTLSNIGAEAAQAMSVLALHGSTEVLAKVLEAFEKCRLSNADDTVCQAIPSMTDRLLLAEGRPQRFGTQWWFDGSGWPFLPTVEDIKDVNERRAEYGIEPLRWPKSLARPESEQPWLKRPISEMTMRDPTPEERQANS